MEHARLSAVPRYWWQQSVQQCKDCKRSGYKANPLQPKRSIVAFHNVWLSVFGVDLELAWGFVKPK